jgi:WD40 repeat protein/transcriptional regulator with XRE-family HTH domain
MVDSQAAADEAKSFRGLVLSYRGRTRLTQRELAARMGAARRTVQDWETGVNYPTADRLRALILVFLDAGGLRTGHEVVEAQELWAAALREAPRMHTPFDEVWFGERLAARVAAEPPNPFSGGVQAEREPTPVVVATAEQRLDWGEAPDVLGFVGRTQELATLREWVLEGPCRLAAVVGMGGIGKTILAARLVQEVAPAFQRVFWRSLRDALPTSEWLGAAIGFLSDQQVVPPDGEAARFAALLRLLRDRHSLLVLDNFETVLEPGEHEARYRAGYAGYGRVLQTIGGGRHESCLVVTSREAPPELEVLPHDAVRTLHLGGLGVAEAQRLLADKHLQGSAPDWFALIDRFGGNGLALKVVGERIRELFAGDVGAFLDEGGAGMVFGGIRRLLAEQIERGSALEQEVLRVLAVGREPMTLAQLLTELGSRIRRGAVLEAIEALRRRSLVERAEIAGPAAFTQQSVVLEYVTDRIVEKAADEIMHARPELIVDQPLIKAVAKDYVRETQERLIGEPILGLLKANRISGGAEPRLLALLNGWRNRPEPEQGYGPGNVFNLLRVLRGDVRGVNLAQLVLRQAYLEGVEAQDASLAGAHLHEAVLAEAFSFPISVALSGDGTWLVAGTGAGELRLWRLADRTALLAVEAHAGPVCGVALSSDGRLLASGGQDGTLRLWQVPGGQLLATVEGHTGGVWDVALSADGRLVATGSWDGTVRLCEAPGGQLLATLHGHVGPVYGVALGADGRLLASGGEDGIVRVWDAPTGRVLSTLDDHMGPVLGVALSADGRLLATGSWDGAVRVWEPTGGLLATLQGHVGPVRDVTLSADGRTLASGGIDGMVRLWEAPGGRLLATLRGHSGAVRDVALSADARVLASGGVDCAMRLWEAATGRPLATLAGHTGIVYGVVASTDGSLLAGASIDGLVRLWEAGSGQLLATLPGHTGPVRDVALSADARLLASGSWDGTVRLWEAPGGRLLSTLQGHVGPVYGVALSEDGRLLASAGEDASVRLWEAPTGRALATLEGHTAGVRALALSADARLLASGSWDGTVRLWAVPGGQMVAALEGHVGPAYDVALSADGRLLASCGEDRTVRLWEATSGRMLVTLEGHADGVWGVALSGDGSLVASGSFDGTICLWEAGARRLVTMLHRHSGAVRTVALSSDGRILASGGEDGTIRLWEAHSGTYLRTLRSDRRYERVDITGLTGVNAAQRAALLALGAVDRLSGA